MQVINYKGNVYTFDQTDSFILCIVLLILIELTKAEQKELKIQDTKILDLLRILCNTSDPTQFALAKKKLIILLHPDRWRNSISVDEPAVKCLMEFFVREDVVNIVGAKLDLQGILTRASLAISNYRLDLYSVDRRPNDEQIKAFFMTLIRLDQPMPVPVVAPNRQSTMVGLAILSVAFATLIWSRVENKEKVDRVEERNPRSPTKKP